MMTANSYGTRESVIEFKTMYEESWAHHIGRVRGDRKGAVIELDIIPIDSEDYLMNVGTYTIVQPTKDGKQIMPYDYRWGTGSMYFRGPGHQSVWQSDSTGGCIAPMQADSLPVLELRNYLGSHRSIPGYWILCNGLLLPDNYVDVALEDSEARHHCKELMKGMFGFSDVRRLNAQGRIMLAQQLRRRLHLSSRQIASLVRLPYSEVCKYV